MNLFRIVLSHLKRRKIKTVLLGIALTLGVALVVAMISMVAAMRLELGNELDKFGPNIVIMPRAEGVQLSYEGSQFSEVAFDLKPLTPEDVQKIKTIKDRESLNIISPKLVGAVKLNDRSALMVGIDSQSEFTMKPWFSLNEDSVASLGDGLSDLKEMVLPEDGLILGSGAATDFGLEVGDSASINGQSFKVTGILNESGNDEDGLIFGKLATVQKLLQYEGGFSLIEVSGFCNFCPIEDMASQITDVLPNAKVTALRQAALVREETINRFETFGILFSVASILLTVLFGITTVLSSVNERTQEIGIFRAIGFRKAAIIQIIVIEAMAVSLLAGAVGFTGGILIAKILGPIFGHITVPIPWNFSLLLPALILSMGLAVISSLYPAVKAANLDPVDAIRFI